MAFAQSELSS